MRIGVTGPGGMLGAEVLRAAHEHGRHSAVPMVGNICNFLNMQQYHKEVDVIINCAGITEYSPVHDPIRMIESNATGPYCLARLGIPILHVSTDCVFSGNKKPRGSYHYVVDNPDPITIYGRSKLLGEVEGPRICNVRTSFIGRRHGLLKWLIDNRGKSVPGYTNAIWTGSTVQEVAKRLVDIAPMVARGDLRGIQHLAPRKILTKYDLLNLINEQLQLDLTIMPYNVGVNRALLSTIDLRGLDEVSIDD